MLYVRNARLYIIFAVWEIYKYYFITKRKPGDDRASLYEQFQSSLEAAGAVAGAAGA